MPTYPILRVDVPTLPLAMLCNGAGKGLTEHSKFVLFGHKVVLSDVTQLAQ
jgi:hypothetical protein